MTDTAYEPVKVHIVADATKGDAAPPKRRQHRAVYQTFLLTAANPTECILPADEDRVSAYVQALDNDIVLGHTQGIVGNGVNMVTGAPAPYGALVPHANTAPFPVDDNAAVFAGATTAASSSRVTVIASYRDG
jgi:hypothetical protein